MDLYEITAGATSRRIAVWLADSSSTVGAGLTGLAYNTASFTCYYWREDEGNANATAVTLATATRGTFTSSGFIEKDATNTPGLYEFGLPNNAIATGAKWVKVMFKGATNLAQKVVMVKLTSFDLDTASTPQTGDNYPRIGAPVGASISADIAGVQSDTDNLQTRVPAALVGGRMDSSVGAMAANVLTATAIAADAITDAKVAADVTIASVTGAVGSVTGAVGSVTGAVGSVTGAVGSVTGNVGGNVVGSVASVTGNVGGNVVGSVASVTATVNADLKKINGTTVNGDGSATPWGP